MSIEPSSTQEPSHQQKLRIELKEWEKAFAAANGGRKAGREDIKKVPEIAAKYKSYNKIRAKALSQNPFATQQSSSPPPSKTRKVQEVSTPRKSHAIGSRSRHKEVQSSQHHPSALDPYDAPSAQSTPSSVRTRRAIGPTPQKNGQVLGLFDLLSPASTKERRAAEATPSRKTPLETTTANTTADLDTVALERLVHSTAANLGPTEANLHTTPSKSRTATLPNITEGSELNLTPAPRRLGRTPQSSGKRKFLDAFLTPSTRRTDTLSSYVLGKGEQDTTPSSRAKQGTAAIMAESDALATSLLVPAPSEPTTAPDGLDTTPVFLRRFTASTKRPLNDAAAAESLLGTDIPAVRLPRRKPFGRSLSEMVRSLREEREEEMDEEEAIMREMEMEAENGGEGGGPPKRPKILVRDSQSAGLTTTAMGIGTDFCDGGGERGEEKEMRLGADGQWSSEEDEGIDNGKREEEKRKKWKKKGQKRTTRKANIKPRTAKWVPEKEWVGGEEEDEEAGPEDRTVGETQPADENEGGEGESDVGSDAEYDDTSQAKQPPAKAKRGRPKSKATEEGDGKRAENKEKEKAKKPRKVNALAHANFRALKIKNKGSKGRGGRFGRRR